MYEVFSERPHTCNICGGAHNINQCPIATSTEEVDYLGYSDRDQTSCQQIPKLSWQEARRFAPAGYSSFNAHS